MLAGPVPSEPRSQKTPFFWARRDARRSALDARPPSQLSTLPPNSPSSLPPSLPPSLSSLPAPPPPPPFPGYFVRMRLLRLLAVGVLSLQLLTRKGGILPPGCATVRLPSALADSLSPSIRLCARQGIRKSVAVGSVFLAPPVSSLPPASVRHFKPLIFVFLFFSIQVPRFGVLGRPGKSKEDWGRPREERRKHGIRFACFLRTVRGYFVVRER